MSDIAHRNMNVHTNNITSLKNKFVTVCKTGDDNGALEILKQMRIIHGRALYESAIDKQNIFTKGVEHATDDDWIKLSTNDSFLYVMHDHIRNCEKLAYQCKKGSTMPIQVSSDSELKTATQSNLGKESSFANAMSKRTSSREQSKASGVTPIVNKISENTEELSLQNIQTETPSYTMSDNMSEFRLGDLFETDDRETLIVKKIGEFGQNLSKNAAEFGQNLTKKATEIGQNLTKNAAEIGQNLTKNIMTGGENKLIDNTSYDMNTSEYINNITSTEASRLASEYQKMQPSLNQANTNSIKTLGQINKTLDINKPTLVYYWADWCGYSIKFNPTWKEFETNSKNKFPNLQIVELNVNDDKQILNGKKLSKVELNKLASDVGVEGYPTIVLFYNKKTYPKIVSRASVDDINNFIKNIMGPSS